MFFIASLRWIDDLYEEPRKRVTKQKVNSSLEEMKRVDREREKRKKGRLWRAVCFTFLFFLFLPFF